MSEHSVGGTDVTAHVGDDGVRFVDGGTGMAVTVPDDKTGSVVDFIHAHADECESTARADPGVVARRNLSGDVSVAYWNDGLFGVTDDARAQTVIIPQECIGAVETILSDA